jgi:putative transposase
LNRRILDAAPGMFLSLLHQKLCDRRGGGNVQVIPAYSSQDCSALVDGVVCGARNNCGSNETYTCATCGSVMDRDVNAAKNILARARVVVAGWSPTEKSMWSNGKSLRVRKSGLKARERKRVPVGVRNVSV